MRCSSARAIAPTGRRSRCARRPALARARAAAPARSASSACAAASVELAELELQLRRRLLVGRHLLHGRFDRALQLARGAPAACASRTAPPARRARARATARAPARAGARHRARLRRARHGAAAWSPVAGRALRSAPRASARRWFRSRELRVDLGQLAFELPAPRARGLGQLRQAQRFDLQLVRARLRVVGFAARLCAAAATPRCTAPRRAPARSSIRRRSTTARATGARGFRSPARARACRPARNRARRSSPRRRSPRGPRAS